MRFLSVSACYFAFTLAGFAQNDRGTITGTVSDPVSAVVPGAAITATNSETAVVSKTVATQTGNYTLPSLPAGVYDVSVEAPGFKKFIQQGIQVQVAQTVRLNMSLQVGTASESVTVHADAPLLKTESAEQSTNVTGERINSLPLNFGGGGGSIGGIRSAYAFNVLSPGVVGSGQGANINGLPANTFRVQIEGQDYTSANDTGWTSTVTQASVEMVEEFSLQTSNFAAEFGQVAGGFYNFTTRSGTNQFHGTGYEYFTNEALDARRPFTYARPVNRKNDFGGTAGGPVWIPKIYDGRNKTFFFFNYEMFRNHVSSAGAFQTLPTAAMRTGDFSQILTGRQLGTDALGRPIMENTIYDPATARTINGQVVTDAFPNNIIPVNRIDAVASKIQSLIPAPTNSGLTLNWAQNAPNSKIQAIPSVKIDQIFRDNSKLSFYLSKQRTDQFTAPDGLPAPITTIRVQAIYGWTERLNYDRSITPRLLVHLGAGYVRFHNPDSSPASVLQYDTAGQLGFTGSATTPGGFPRINGLTGAALNAGSSLSFGPSNANSYYDGTLTSVAGATYVRGNHTYKLGGEFRLNSWTDRNSRGAQGILNFSTAETGLPYLQTTTVGGGTIGFPYASFLLGRVDNATVNAVQDPQLRKKAWGLYVQDTWKFTRKLTLDYGLRWDLEGEGHEIHWRTSMFGPATPNPSAGNLPGALIYEGYGSKRCNCQFTKTYPYAIGPRLGVAYQVTPKTVFRGGWGITYGAVPTYSYITNAALLGVGFNQLTFSSPSYGSPGVILSQGLQYNHADLYTATLDPGLVPSPGQLNSPNYYLDPNGGRPSRIVQWSLGIQREITRDLVVEAAYVGNRGVWEQATSLINLNAIDSNKLAALGLNLNSSADRQVLTSTLSSPLAQSRGFKAPYAGYPLSATVAQSLRPYPQFNSGISVRWSPLGDSWYDSLQTKVTKRYSRGLTLTGAFTWSKTEANPGGTVNNVFNRKNQKSITSYDQPFVFTTGFNYDMPKIGQNNLVRAVVGGWTFGGLLSYGSGLPIASPASQNNLSSVIFQSTLMNRVPGVSLFTKNLNCHCIDPNKDFVLNSAAWTDAAPGQWGAAAAYYSDYRYARRPSEQLSLGRLFRIREKMSFQIRAEFFNVFNRTYLADPSVANPLQIQARDANGVPRSGFGYINATSLKTPPRNGQLVARFQW